MSRYLDRTARVFVRMTDAMMERLRLSAELQGRDLNSQIIKMIEYGMAVDVLAQEQTQKIIEQLKKEIKDGIKQDD